MAMEKTNGPIGVAAVAAGIIAMWVLVRLPGNAVGFLLMQDKT